MPATSQLDWLISMTAMIVLFWSRATRDLLKSFGWGITGTPSIRCSDEVAIPRRPPHSVSRSRSRERARCLGVRPAEGKFVRTNFGRGVIAVSSVCCGRPPSEGLGADLGYAGCRGARHAAAPPSGDTIIDSQARHSRIARTPAPDRQDVAL